MNTLEKQLTIAIDPPPPRRLFQFTVQQYEHMAEAGILGSSDRVELLEGWIVKKMTQNPPHAVALDKTLDAIRAVLPTGWRTREQKPIHLAASMPEPDLVVIRGPIGRYARRHPVAADIALVIEVADASLDDDRGFKQFIYAKAHLPTYWIVNIVDRQVEVYTEPKSGRHPAYRQHKDYSADAEVPVVIDGIEAGFLQVGDLLP
jgi:hypothetical protein